MKKLILTFLLVLLPFIGKSDNDGVIVSNGTDHDVNLFVLDMCNLMDITDVSITIYYIPSAIKVPEDFVLYAFIEQYLYKKYLIFINEDITSKYLIKKIIIHELMHLKQYLDKDLERLSSYEFRYKNKKVNLRYVDYHERQFEIDAHRHVYDFTRKHKEIIKSHN